MVSNTEDCVTTDLQVHSSYILSCTYMWLWLNTAVQYCSVILPGFPLAWTELRVVCINM